MAICIIIFALVHFAGFDNSSESAILYGAYYKAFIVAGEWWRLITVGFVHVQVWHIVMNLAAFWSLGSILEHIYGRLKYAVILFVSILSGSLFLFIMTGNEVSVGLSGGLYGLMAAEIYWVVKNGGLQNPSVKNPLIETVVINAAINFVGGVAWQAHIGGFIGGLILAVLFDTDPSVASLRKNTAVSSVILCVVLGYFVSRSCTIPTDEQYIGSDYRILEYEKEHGLSKHAENMATRLDEIYGTTILSSYIKGE
jgi:rhomboid protease GluP